MFLAKKYRAAVGQFLIWRTLPLNCGPLHETLPWMLCLIPTAVALRTKLWSTIYVHWGAP